MARRVPLCYGRGWIQRDAAVAAFHARRRANAAARRRQPAKRPEPHRTAVPQPPTSTELLPPTPTAAPAATLSSKEVATQLAVSYRQLHFWVTKGWIPGLVPNGSGSQPTRPHPFAAWTADARATGGRGPASAPAASLRQLLDGLP